VGRGTIDGYSPPRVRFCWTSGRCSQGRLVDESVLPSARREPYYFSSAPRIMLKLDRESCFAYRSIDVKIRAEIFLTVVESFECFTRVDVNISKISCVPSPILIIIIGIT
jgi:hypothetical protein